MKEKTEDTGYVRSTYFLQKFIYRRSLNEIQKSAVWVCVYPAVPMFELRKHSKQISGS
jgi:hypothetical protein